MALVDFYPSMQPSAAEVQNGKFFTLPIRPTKITQILSVLTHFISHSDTKFALVKSFLGQGSGLGMKVRTGFTSTH